MRTKKLAKKSSSSSSSKKQPQTTLALAKKQPPAVTLSVAEFKKADVNSNVTSLTIEGPMHDDDGDESINTDDKIHELFPKLQHLYLNCCVDMSNLPLWLNKCKELVHISLGGSGLQSLMWCAGKTQARNITKLSWMHKGMDNPLKGHPGCVPRCFPALRVFEVAYCGENNLDLSQCACETLSLLYDGPLIGKGVPELVEAGFSSNTKNVQIVGPSTTHSIKGIFEEQFTLFYNIIKAVVEQNSVSLKMIGRGSFGNHQGLLMFSHSIFLLPSSTKFLTVCVDDIKFLVAQGGSKPVSGNAWDTEKSRKLWNGLVDNDPKSPWLIGHGFACADLWDLRVYMEGTPPPSLPSTRPVNSQPSSRADPFDEFERQNSDWHRNPLFQIINPNDSFRRADKSYAFIYNYFNKLDIQTILGEQTIQKLGAGAYGSVYLHKMKLPDNTFGSAAIKTISPISEPCFAIEMQCIQLGHEMAKKALSPHFLYLYKCEFHRHQMLPIFMMTERGHYKFENIAFLPQDKVNPNAKVLQCSSVEVLCKMAIQMVFVIYSLRSRNLVVDGDMHWRVQKFASPKTLRYSIEFAQLGATMLHPDNFIVSGVQAGVYLDPQLCPTKTVIGLANWRDTRTALLALATLVDKAAGEMQARRWPSLCMLFQSGKGAAEVAHSMVTELLRIAISNQSSPATPAPAPAPVEPVTTFFLDTNTSKASIFMAMETAKGVLFDYGFGSREDVAVAAIQMVMALLALHQQGYTHDDAHSKNWLYKELDTPQKFCYKLKGGQKQVIVENVKMLMVLADFGRAIPLNANRTYIAEGDYVRAMGAIEIALEDIGHELDLAPYIRKNFNKFPTEQDFALALIKDSFATMLTQTDTPITATYDMDRQLGGYREYEGGDEVEEEFRLLFRTPK